ncbi:MAG: L,D-transpeptidase family protein [Firmicutes bacterium]|nr:L,D-transpeptidase family protein [Bacillota bacterium]
MFSFTSSFRKRLLPVALGPVTILACFCWFLSTAGGWLLQPDYTTRPALFLSHQNKLRPFEPITFTATEELVSGKIQVQGVPGQTVRDHHRLIFHPDRLYPFADELQVKVEGWFRSGENFTEIYVLETADYSERMWVEAVEGERPQLVRVWRGEEVQAAFPASFGKAGSPTPGGVFYIKDRGREFWSEKYQEGAYYWVRFQGNYLFHSVPFDRNKVLKKSEEAKLGSPASHGCIRLSVKDAKWFYENVPDGTYVIIRKALPKPEAAKTFSTGRDKLVIAMATDVVKLDPHDTSDNPSAIVNMHLFDTLLELGEDGNLRPALALSVEPRKNAQEWVVKLRPGVFFQDGTPLTAEEVKASFQRLLDPTLKLARRGLFAEYLQKVVATGPFTLRFYLNQPLVILPFFLAHTSAAIVKPTADGGLVGTGPYILKKWEPGYELVLTKGHYHWRKEPYFEKLVFKTVPEASARSVLLETGTCDVAFPLSPLEVQRLAKKDGIKVLTEPSHRVIYIGMNLTKPLFRRPEVRQALNYAIDKKALISRLLGGLAEESTSPLAPTAVGYHRCASFPYDPQKARELLKSAGALGAKVTLWAPKGRYLQDHKVAEAVAGYLTEVGLAVELKLWEWSSYMSMLNRNSPQWDLFLLGWVPATGEAYMGLAPLFGAESRSNLTFYRNPQVEKILNEALKTEDPGERNALFAQVQELVTDFAPWIFLYVQDQTVGLAREINGVEVLPTEVLAFHRAWRNQ